MDLENMLRMVDHLALTRDVIQFNTQQGRHWLNGVFQTQLREMEQELRTTSSLARTSSTGGGRVRGNVPESVANRLGPLAMETGAAAPVAPSSDVREGLGTAPPPRAQPLESRLGRSVDQNRTSSQTVSRRNDPPATANLASTTGQLMSAVSAAEGDEPGSVLLWNRPDPSGWGQCRTDIRQGGVDDEQNFVRPLLELYQDMPLAIPNKESNDMESYRRLEEVRRYSNKELKMSRELIEAVRGQKDNATLGKLKSFQYVSGIPGMANNPFVNEEAREAYFDYEQVIVLNFWVEQVKETGILMVEQAKLGIVLEERVVEPSVPELKGQVSFDCSSWDGPLKTNLVTMWELMKPS